MDAITPLCKSFQFTHPGRGATSTTNSSGIECSVSIHAPREGCDEIAVLPSKSSRLFQFTHPGRGATTTNIGGCRQGMFQFTHPGRGATVD